MSDALKKSGRKIVLELAASGASKPWIWAAEAGGQVWRTSNDLVDSWNSPQENNQNAGTIKPGILQAIDLTSSYHQLAGVGLWPNAGNLVVGLKDDRISSPASEGHQSTEIEHQSQMSIWSMISSALFTVIDIDQLDAASRRILLNDEIIAINQDSLGKPAERVIHTADWSVWLRQLNNGDYAVAILNRSDKTKTYSIAWTELGLTDQYVIRDVWLHQLIGKGRRWRGKVLSHETRVFRLKKV